MTLFLQSPILQMNVLNVTIAESGVTLKEDEVAETVEIRKRLWKFVYENQVNCQEVFLPGKFFTHHCNVIFKKYYVAIAQKKLQPCHTVCRQNLPIEKLSEC